MYHCKVEVVIFSEQGGLKAILEGCGVPEGFTYSFREEKECLSGEEKADVIIWDLPGAVPSAVFTKPETVRVLCRTQTQLAQMSEEELHAVDELWEKPFSETLLSFRFRQLQSLLKLRRDYRMNRDWLDTAIDSIPELVWFKDVRGSHLKVNNSFCHAVGKTKEQIQGRGHYYIWDLKREDYEKGEYVCLETEEEVIRAKKTCLFDERVKSRRGLRQFKTYKSPLFDDDGEVIGTVGIAHDVTDLENMSAELEIVLRSLPFSVLIADADGRIVNVNDRCEQYFNIRRDKIIGRSYENWMKELFGDNQPDAAGEVTLQHAQGAQTLKIHGEPLYDVFGTLVGQFYICQDVTIERAYESKMLEYANTDFLTGLYNRRYFKDHVEESRGEKLGVLYLDLDNFKYVNDTYGHQVGDRALAVAAEALQEACPNELIARVGGDEFLIALWDCPAEYVLQKKAEKILESVSRIFQQLPQTKTLSTSVGGVFSASREDNLDELVRRSDAALYAAKAQGRNRYCVYTPELDKDGKFSPVGER